MGNNGSRSSDDNSEFLLVLEGPLESAAQVKHIAGLEEVPKQVSNQDGLTNYVIVDGLAKNCITQKLASGNFQPTFHPYQRMRPAEKALSSTSWHPKLGIDTTLPQFRPTGTVSPLQDEYPVWYFFYGTLADPKRLANMLELSAEPVLSEATIYGGKIKTWAGKYKALVDADADEAVHGWAYHVTSQEDEYALCWYEQGKYEVVRCDIGIDGLGVVSGLTFRFVNEIELQ
jgi:hypothetical protein